MPENAELLRIVNNEIVACRKCPRLVVYRENVAREKPLACRDGTDWGKPVPGVGDPQAQLLIVGLAPGAHGSNRTGRMFTGDRSGIFLYQALYDAGFANQPTALNSEDGLRLKNVYIAAAARCAPPDNKPLPSEILNCRPYLEREIDILQPRAEVDCPAAGLRLFGVYHPSQQNTQTGLLTPAMYAKVLRRIRRSLDQDASVKTRGKTIAGTSK